jgi:hypothetical protein
MHYTVKLHFKVNGTRRMVHTFIRPEYAMNMSSHATTFATMDEAENAADVTVEQMSATGRVTFISADFYKVGQ